MYLQFLLNAGAAIELSGAGFLIAVAVFACLLGVEIAGILILSGKLSRARREKQEIERQNRDYSERYHYAIPVLALGAIPQATYLALSILAGLVAIGAVVFAILLVVARKKGYLFISAKDAAALAEAEKNPRTLSNEPEILPDEEEQRQEAYTEPEAVTEDAFAVFDESYDEAFDENEFVVAQEEEDPVAVESVAEESAQAQGQTAAQKKGLLSTILTAHRSRENMTEAPGNTTLG